MAMTGYSRSFRSILTAALAVIVAAPALIFGRLERTFLDLIGRFEVDPRPFLGRLGLVPPALYVPGGPQIDAATYQRNRHEAGLARLGAVRHT